jgi:hypothetical protein
VGLVPSQHGRDGEGRMGGMGEPIGRVVLEFVRRDALAAVIPALPIPAAPDLWALPVGRCEDGAVFTIRLHGTHLLIAGSTGADLPHAVAVRLSQVLTCRNGLALLLDAHFRRWRCRRCLHETCSKDGHRSAGYARRSGGPA